MNPTELLNDIDSFWDIEIVPTISEYIKIPNKSPAFDPHWEKNGHMGRVIDLVSGWIQTHKPDNSSLHVLKEPGRTPLLLLDIPGERVGSILMYGHLDKQPEMAGWAAGLEPWRPVLKNDKLYGRGAADDGYAVFASVSSIDALLNQGLALPHIVVLIECSEESGSPDLPFYMDHCADKIGRPNLVICLDSGTGNYEQFWTTTSLRGLINFSLRVDILKEGVHSGGASGIAPSSFRIMRQLLSRLENEETGQIIIADLHVEIPDHRLKEMRTMTTELGDEVFNTLPWSNNAKPITNDLLELVVNNTWRPMLAVVGVDGLPAVKDGGNVLRPYTTIKLSLRLPPTLDVRKAQQILVELLRSDPPYGALINLKFDEPATGWATPQLTPWLDQAIQNASQTVFNKPALAMGEGGTIPFMAMLGEKFPDAQFVITGVLGPQSNAHGPNEFLHIPYAKKLTGCIALIINDFKQ